VRPVQNESDSKLVGDAPTLPGALHAHYGSWLNLVERWFAELTNKSSAGAHRSVAQLEAPIRSSNVHQAT
jgi:hypothetical protein